jgi:hypothetical protein
MVGCIHTQQEHVSVSEIQLQILELAMEIGFNGTDQRKAMETLESYSDEMTNDNL